MYIIVVKSLDCGFWESSMEILVLPLSRVSKLCNRFKPRSPYCQDTENNSTEEDYSLSCLRLTCLDE